MKFHALLVISLSGLVACKKTTSNQQPAADQAPAAASPKPTTTPAPAPAPAASAGTAFQHPDPAFTIEVPAGYVPNTAMRTGPGNTTIRLAKPDEHSNIDGFVSVTWWDDKTIYETLLRQIQPDRTAKAVVEGDLAGGKHFSFDDTAQKMIEGELKEATRHRGRSVARGESKVFTCSVESFEAKPDPTLMRACATLAVK